jgi:hypothetical protein
MKNVITRPAKVRLYRLAMNMQENISTFYVFKRQWLHCPWLALFCLLKSTPCSSLSSQPICWKLSVENLLMKFFLAAVSFSHRFCLPECLASPASENCPNPRVILQFQICIGERALSTATGRKFVFTKTEKTRSRRSGKSFPFLISISNNLYHRLMIQYDLSQALKCLKCLVKCQRTR